MARLGADDASVASDDIGDREWTFPDLNIFSDEERVFHFRRLGLSPEALRAFHTNGYRTWTSEGGGGIAQTEAAMWEQIGISMGEREILRAGLDLHRNDPDAYARNYNLPQADMAVGLQVPVLHLPGSAAAPQAGFAAEDPTITTVCVIFGMMLKVWGKFLRKMVHKAFAPEHRTKTLVVVIALLCLWPTYSIVGAIITWWSTPAVVAATVVVDCVEGSTRVLTADRKKIRIDELKAGDYVLSFNRGKYIVCRVREVTKTTSKDVSTIKFSNATSVTATRNHPFWVQGKKWCAVQADENGPMKLQQLQVGDNCINTKGQLVQVTSIKDVALGSSSTTFNLVIEGAGSWFANGILSHSGMRAKVDNLKRVDNTL